MLSNKANTVSILLSIDLCFTQKNKRASKEQNMLKIIGYITGIFTILLTILKLAFQIYQGYWSYFEMEQLSVQVISIIQSILLGVFIILLASKLK